MRVHTHKAKYKEHTCTKCEDPIKKGEEYFQYQRKGSSPTRFHTKHGYPRTSELCSGKMSEVYAAVESIEDAVANARSNHDPEGLADTLREAAQSVESVKDEYESSRSSMPDHLQDVGTGAEMQEKIDALESFKDSLESAADEIDGETVPEEPEMDETPTEEQETAHEEWETAIEEIISKAEDASQELSI